MGMWLLLLHLSVKPVVNGNVIYIYHTGQGYLPRSCRRACRVVVRGMGAQEEARTISAGVVKLKPPDSLS